MRYSRQYQPQGSAKVIATAEPSKQPPSKKPVIALGAVFLLLFCLTILRWFMSPAWNINAIEVRGSTMISEVDIKTVLETMPQKNIFSFDANTFSEKLVKTFPLIQSAAIGKNYISWGVGDDGTFRKTIVVLLQEDSPVAVWVLGDKELFINNEGIIIGSVTSTNATSVSLPRIEAYAMDEDEAVVGVHVVQTQVLTKIKELAPRIEQVTKKTVQKVQAIDKRDFQFLLNNGVTIRCTVEKNTLVMLDHLKAVYDKISSGTIKVLEYVDLRFAQERVK